MQNCNTCQEKSFWIILISGETSPADFSTGVGGGGRVPRSRVPPLSALMQPSYNSESTEPIATIANSLVATPFDSAYVIDFISVVRGVVSIGVGTEGAKGAMAPGLYSTHESTATWFKLSAFSDGLLASVTIRYELYHEYNRTT